VSYAILFSMITTLSYHVKLPQPFVEKVVCEISREKCFFNECDMCINGQRLQEIEIPVDVADEEVQVTLWQKRKNENFGGTAFVKVKVTQTVKALYQVSEMVELLCFILYNAFALYSDNFRKFSSI
jgi:hypothetical protein